MSVIDQKLRVLSGTNSALSDLKNIAVIAYRHARYEQAVELFAHLLMIDKTDWIAAFYLAMAYNHLGQFHEARLLFKKVSNECDVPDLANKAAYLLKAIEGRNVEHLNLDAQRTQAKAE